MHQHNSCLICNEELTNTNRYILADNLICTKCHNKFIYQYKKIKLNNISCFVIYLYNDFFRKILLQIKANGDQKLSSSLLSHLRIYLKFKYFGYTLLPAPSTEKSNNYRGFIHLNEIFKPLSLPITNAFYKSKNYKQSNQKGLERISVNNIIRLHTSMLSHKKKYLIVDDLITTGQTIKKCIELLKGFRVKKIKVLILASKGGKHDKG